MLSRSPGLGGTGSQNPTPASQHMHSRHTASLILEGVPGIVLITTDPGQPFAVEYSPPPDPEISEQVKVYEFGVPPLGRNDPGAPRPMALETFNPTWLLSSISTDAAWHGKPQSAFTTLEISPGGDLTFIVNDDTGAVLETVTVKPTKRKDW